MIPRTYNPLYNIYPKQPVAFFHWPNEDLSAQVLQWESARRWEESGKSQLTG